MLSDVDFVAETANQGDLPSGGTVGFRATMSLLAEANPTPSANGINEALDFLVLDLTLRNPGTFAWEDLTTAIDNDDLRLGFHVISIGGAGSESFVSSIPLPSASILAIGGIGAIGLRRRR